MGILQMRVAIITGSGSGLGRETAIAFAKEGARVVVCGRTQSSINETVSRIQSNGGEAIAIKADIRKETEVKQLIESTISKYGKIEILVNNAAVLTTDYVADTHLDNWEDQIKTNLTGAFLMIREVIQPMRKQQYGRVINITSALATNGAGGYAAYSVSKAGLESLTRTVSEEESRHNILVNLFDPGTIRSNMHATGKNPSNAAPEIIRLASLPNSGPSGQLVVSG